ncbi:glycosyltransferase family A protein [Catenovulum sediminis]
MKNLALVVTSSESHNLVEKLFSSLEEQNACIRIHVYFVNQHVERYNLDGKFKNIVIDVIEINHVIPLSVARNLALDCIGFGEYDLIAFPDDDCWYPSNLIAELERFFDDNEDVDVVCTNVYDPSNGLSYGGRPFDIIEKINMRNIFDLPISVGIFIRLKNIKLDAIRYDENIGAGRKIGSGEETKLIYELLKHKGNIVYNGYLRVCHPVLNKEYKLSDIHKYYKYAVGFGYIAGIMIRERSYVTIWVFLYYVGRTFLGLCRYVTNSINRKIYINRLKGMLAGIVKGLGCNDQ